MSDHFRMARPPSIRDEDILEAARAVLLERGLSSTTAHVAERAGVSEGSIFHRFKTKEGLFQAAVQTEMPPGWIVALAGRVGKGDVLDQITEVAHAGIAFFRILIPFVMLNWSRGPHDARGRFEADPPVIRSLKALSAYFEAEMKLGRLAHHDPEVVARTFSGALWNYVSMELMFDSPKHMPLAETTFVRSYVRLLFEGLAPSAKAAPPSLPKKR